MVPPHLLGLSGALRKGSTNTRLLHEAARLFGDADLTLGNLDLPLYNGDVEDTDGIPAAVHRLADQIAAADAIVISTPEYNGAPSGVLKNALDWVSRVSGNPWKDKPVAIMSAASGRAGGARAQVILRSNMVPFRTRLQQGPEVMLADASNQFDENGQLTDESYVKALTLLMQNLKHELDR